MISLDYRDGRPLYQQVKDNLRRMMLTGLLPPDEKLPSVRSLATQLAINPNTIQRAYSELRRRATSTPWRARAALPPRAVMSSSAASGS